MANRKHTNRFLQNSYNKHGPDAFVYELLHEVTDANELLKYEQQWIDTLKPAYNICPVAGSSLGRQHTTATKRIMSAAKLGKPSNNAKIRLKATRRDGLIIIYDSWTEAAASGFNYGSIYRCLKNNRYHLGFRWERLK